MRKYPIGVQTFEKIRREGYLYIDKTAYVYDIVTGGNYYFLSRPRRFGKSLFLSTIQAYFEGKKELFEGLAIAKQEKEWNDFPILRLDLNAREYKDENSLQKELCRHLETWELQYGDEYRNRDPEERFLHIIDKAYEQTGKRVVILVDEYDKPLLQAIDQPKLQDKYRNTLKAFYGVLKTQDNKIRFALLTGVTKFGKISVFSDLNNLNDISMDAQYHSICGITEAELKAYFPTEIKRLAEAEGISEEECLAQLRLRYDGYHFEEKSTEGIYNPFSILKTFYSNKFGSYWFETGTPSYLVNLLQQHDWNLDAMQNAEVTADTLNSIDGDTQNPIPVIYQSGYLTIKSYDKEFEEYRLGFPNKEVEEGFVKFLAPYYLSPTRGKTSFDIKNFVRDIRNGQPEQFCQRLKSLFADTPYEIVKDLENHYQNIVWVVFKLLGFYTQAEYHTSEGRIDLLVAASDYIYVMEFKLDGTAEEAMEQIKSKNYALPFEMDSRKVFCIGMNFQNKTRNIERWIIE